MTASRSRESRRANNKRITTKATKIVEHWYVDSPVDRSTIDVAIHKNKNNLKACGCEMCKNPRRSKWTSNKTKQTYQERKGKDSFNPNEY